MVKLQNPMNVNIPGTSVCTFLIKIFVCSFICILFSMSISFAQAQSFNIPLTSTYEPTLESTSPLDPLVVMHERVSCLAYSSDYQSTPPLITTQGFNIQNLNYSDQYTDLSCQLQGFGGYFRPANWSVRKIYGDGGVDVTGAPNIVLVEGANTILVEVEAGRTVILSIQLPADGFLSFDWNTIGGSTSNVGCSAVVNGNIVNDQHYSSTFLSLGDQLQIALQAKKKVSVQLTNLSFATDALGLVERTWYATSTSNQTLSATQLIAIERFSITDVIFPSHLDGVERPMLGHGASTSPLQTGQPFYDADGNEATRGDQYPLENDKFGFQIQWEDHIEQKGILQTITRTWTITDRCTSSTMNNTQIIKVLEAGPLGGKEELQERGVIPDSYSETANVSFHITSE